LNHISLRHDREEDVMSNEQKKQRPHPRGDRPEHGNDRKAPGHGQPGEDERRREPDEEESRRSGHSRHESDWPPAERSPAEELSPARGQ
jgi:hypothetical protein